MPVEIIVRPTLGSYKYVICRDLGDQAMIDMTSCVSYLAANGDQNSRDELLVAEEGWPSV